MDKFVPIVIDESEHSDSIGLMAVALRKCHICSKWMVKSPSTKWHSAFPIYWNLSFDKQLEAAGWVRNSGVNVDGRNICQECADSGKATIICSLCGKVWPANQAEDSFGEPPEYLCQNCYSTISAALWNEKVEELRKAHQYDWE